jgi:hypothetical protein
VIRIRSAKGRILTLHTATLVLVALLMDFVVAFRKLHFMDAVLILYLLAFQGHSHWLATMASGRSSSSVGTPTSFWRVALISAFVLLSLLSPDTSSHALLTCAGIGCTHWNAIDGRMSALGVDLREGGGA